MEDILDTLLFREELSPDQREALRERLEADSELREAWAHWREVRLHLRSQLEEKLSDRRMLVLYVLEERGDVEALTSRERRVLGQAREDIEAAIDAIPALETVVECIRDDCDDFEDMWETYVDELGVEQSEEGSSQTGRIGEPEDRPARPSQSRENRSSRQWTRRLVGTAVVLALAVGAALFWMQGPSTTTVTVEEGAVRTVALNDGSTVRLVGPSILTHPSDGEEAARRVTLEEGRAFFDVQPREETSFVVETPTATATVLGTQFGVTTAPDTTEVVLARGSVRVDAGTDADDASVLLNPGEKSWVAEGNAPASPSAVDLTSALDWTGLFVFRSTPMETVAQRLSQRYDVQVSVEEGLSGEPVTGTFEQTQSVQQVLDVLAATFGAEVERVASDRYRLVAAQ